jgi:hypothetical protein
MSITIVHHHGFVILKNKWLGITFTWFSPCKRTLPRPTKDGQVTPTRTTEAADPSTSFHYFYCRVRADWPGPRGESKNACWGHRWGPVWLPAEAASRFKLSGPCLLLCNTGLNLSHLALSALYCTKQNPWIMPLSVDASFRLCSFPFMPLSVYAPFRFGKYSILPNYFQLLSVYAPFRIDR